MPIWERIQGSSLHRDKKMGIWAYLMDCESAANGILKLRAELLGTIIICASNIVVAGVHNRHTS